jgi:hypothetical protein
MNEAGGFSFSLKETLIALPVYGAALGVAYDVGFFYGIGIGYFSLFSLSEHILFALPVAPVAIPLAFGISFTTAIINLSRRTWTEIARRVPIFQSRQLPSGVAGEAGGRRFELSGLGLHEWVVLFLLVLLTITSFGREAYFSGTASLVLFLASLNAYVTTAVHQRVAVFGSTVAIGSVVVALVLGVQHANGIREQNATTHSVLLSGGLTPLAGQLIRSGERGLLFLDTSTKTIEFIQWGRIARIQSVPR